MHLAPELVIHRSENDTIVACVARRILHVLPAMPQQTYSILLLRPTFLNKSHFRLSECVALWSSTPCATVEILVGRFCDILF